ncbi:hypothetical protein JOF53_008563 [Crossiella equi]|uniref:Uncharacterized protein n=1 Tax=Crossiella equi TaxID=130796 RepID=A0ABS5ATB2_9PSEU|nr:hypothetical protein [Crossiella equi]MBP2479691.1 hypothetical protein [Crossiella equi]
MTSTPARYYLDYHLLHTLSCVNLNHDDLGPPKSMVYSGREQAGSCASTRAG